MLKCSRFSVEEEPAFEVKTKDETRENFIPEHEPGYRNLTNRWNDPEYGW